MTCPSLPCVDHQLRRPFYVRRSDLLHPLIFLEERDQHWFDRHPLYDRGICDCDLQPLFIDGTARCGLELVMEPPSNPTPILLRFPDEILNIILELLAPQSLSGELITIDHRSSLSVESFASEPSHVSEEHLHVTGTFV